MYAISGYKIDEKLYESSNSLIFYTSGKLTSSKLYKDEYPSP
jgi:hypothetical protein